MSLKNYYLSVLTILAFSIILLISSGGSSLDFIGNNYDLAQEKASTPPGLGNPKIHKLTETVYAITDLYHSAGKLAGVNAGIIFTSGGIIFVDSGMTIASGEFLWEAARKKMKDKEKLYLILTHHHSDHVFGMRAIKEKGARVIAHKIVKAAFKEYDGERYKRFLVERAGWSTEKGDLIFGDVLLSEPEQLIEKDTILNVDDEEIHLVFTPGHTTDSISVYHPKSKTLFAGDTIYEGMRLTTRFGGSEEWKLWISNLERLKQLEINTVVPGHGKLCSKKEIDRNIAYLKELLK
ncbi:MAG: MBL fold metallo-hydrolase [Candidatus Aminicenantes bacterium]|nr:MAG: MBL fold metallo-hydrolase [Candidatus Aminicenantes bacterium]